MKKFKVKYKCNTMYLSWETTIFAKNEEEAHEMASKKGKVLEIIDETDENVLSEDLNA